MRMADWQESLRQPEAVGARDYLQLGRWRLSWWAVGLIGLGVMLVSIFIQPPASPSRMPLESPARETSALGVTETKNAADAAEISLLEVLARAAIVLLAVYGLGWGLVRWRKKIGIGQAAGHAARGTGQRLRLRESLSLGPQQGMLYLVEVDNTTVLLGVSFDQISVLLTLPPEQTATLPPVEGEKPAATMRSVEERSFRPLEGLWGPAASPDVLSKPRPPRPIRREIDWQEQRRRLLQALQAETAEDRAAEIRQE